MNNNVILCQSGIVQEILSNNYLLFVAYIDVGKGHEERKAALLSLT